MRFFVVVAAIIRLTEVGLGASLSASPGESLSGSEDEVGGFRKNNRNAAIQSLSKVFGLIRPPSHKHHRSPPQYMVELYKSVTFSDGITKTKNPFNADVVRGFPDRVPRQQMMFYFNVSYIADTESVQQAELRVFQLRPRLAGASSMSSRLGHFIEMRLYEVADDIQPDPRVGARLLDYRRVSAHAHGWHVFRVLNTIRRWVNNTDANKGFLLTAHSRSGENMNGTWVRFAQRAEHHDSKQPVLVVFTKDQMGQPKYVEPSNSDLLADYTKLKNKKTINSKSRRQQVQFLNERFRAQRRARLRLRRHGAAFTQSYRNPVHRRQKRAASNLDILDKRGTRRRWCSKRQLYVDFEEIGWSGWIISPKGYNAYHCKGQCPFPLGQHQKPTNHATVQSIIHALGLGKDVSSPCCVPNTLFSISLLYFDDDDNVILKQYDDMVAASCGCH